VEFRARDEAGERGHSYVTLGTIDASGGMRQTTVVGFLPKALRTIVGAGVGYRLWASSA
jgi:hypothetical protein